MLPLSLILPPVLIAFLYPSLRSINAITTISGRNKALDVSGRVLLVTAHPDDEAMFFSPTITALTKNTNTELYTVCISTGDMDGDAEQRSAELQRSLDVFGVAPARRWIFDEPELKDNISSRWDAAAIARVVGPIVHQNNITAVLTFDQKGVSSHPNHASLPDGLTYLLSAAKNGKSTTVPRLFTLITTPLHQKYVGPVAPMIAKADLVTSQSFLSLTSKLASYILLALDVPPVDDLATEAPIVVFVSGLPDWGIGFKAMKEHRSQLLWYRWLYLMSSRYMWVNQWTEIAV